MIKKLLFTILLGLSAFANTLIVGSNIPTLTIKDQFEKDYIVDANIKTIIFSATKTEGTTIKEFLLTKDKDYLTTNKTVYIADITGMPSLISKFIAIPKMKKYPFSILLLDDTNKNNFTKEEGKIIVYTLENSKIINISKISKKEELGQNLK